MCPHCGQYGTLNNHGFLKTKTDIVRALRLWCCPRRKGRPGCGRTFSIWLAAFIPGFSVCAIILAKFFTAWHRLGGNVLAAWQSARTGFSTDSAYRWVKRFTRNQGEIRTRLCRARAPPRALAGPVHADLFEHLRLVFGEVSFTKAFQIRFQEPWPMKA